MRIHFFKQTNFEYDRIHNKTKPVHGIIFEHTYVRNNNISAACTRYLNTHFFRPFERPLDGRRWIAVYVAHY